MWISPWRPPNSFSWLQKETKGHSHDNTYCWHLFQHHVESFCILLPWHNLDVLLAIKVNFACLLWCPPYHFWHNGCYDLSDWRDVTFFQIFQWFAWWQKHDNRSWVNLGESWVKKNYILHVSLLYSWRASGQKPWKTTSGLIRHLAACLVYNKQIGSDIVTSKFCHISLWNTHRAGTGSLNLLCVRMLVSSELALWRDGKQT